MIISAKFASKCPKCAGDIRVGDKVAWERGAPARHVDCRIGHPLTCHVLLRNGSKFGRGARKEWSMRVARHLPEMWNETDGAAIRAAAESIKVRIR